VPVHAGSSGGWGSWALYEAEVARSLGDARAMAAAPVSCPNDGEPLSEDLRGDLFCRYDGWRP
jgi:hypothetical protein